MLAPVAAPRFKASGRAFAHIAQFHPELTSLRRDMHAHPELGFEEVARKIDQLRPHDRIVLHMPYGTFTYEVERTRIVSPTAWWITRRGAYDRLVLSACHPLYSAAQRIVVFARLVRSEPRGDAA